MSELMTLAEVAAYTRTAESTLRYWRLTGQGPASFKLGRRVRYDRADVDQWLSNQKLLASTGDARERPSS